MINKYYKFTVLLIILLLSWVGLARPQSITVGAKNFNEGYLLAEILAQLFETRGFEVERRYNLGGTLICFGALKNGEIDIYPEYSGTISEQILKANRTLSLSELNDELQQNYELEISSPFGFNNTYAFAILKKTANERSLKKISELKNHPTLKVVFSYEFLKREDGWKNLSLFYQLPQKPVGIEHGLSYQALEEGEVDLIDIYTTDGEINRYDLFVLEDDKEFFPHYQAVALYKMDLLPEAKKLLENLAGSLSEKKMQELKCTGGFL